MLGTLLKPFFKKHLGLFISMVFVSMLSIALLCTFGSTVVNLNRTYSSYLNEYGNIDEQISTNLALRTDMNEAVTGIEEVDAADARISLDTYMKKKDGRTIVARVFSFNEAENKVFKRYVLNSIPKSTEYPNISICRKFALNNSINLGDTIEIGYFSVFLTFHVDEIVETSEGIYPRANDYIWSDNQDFGYLYCAETELSTGLKGLAERVKAKIVADPAFKEAYEKIIATAGITMPDLRDLDPSFVSKFANQLIVRNKTGDGENAVLDKIVANLEANGAKIKTKTIGENLPYRVYMSNAIKQLTVATVFLPVFFYSVTMIVIGLFMNQIIKGMTPDIGILRSIGIDPKQIVGLFLMFGLFMAIAAGILGSIVGYGLNVLMANILIKTYSIPTIPMEMFTAVVLSAIAALVVFAELTTLISTRAIFKITPKDAVIANEAKRRNLPKPIDQTIENAPMNVKLSTNGVFQNPRRFFVSGFSMFASMTLILLTCFFYVAKEEMIGQSVNRRLSFDCQVYLTQKAEQKMIDDLKGQAFLTDFADCYYTYVPVKNADKLYYVECLAVEPGENKLIDIPSADGFGTLSTPTEGVILPRSDAERLGVNKGDTVSINDKQVTVADISYQYFHPIAYMSKTQMDALNASNVVSSFLINVKDEPAFLAYLAENNNQCLTVFTRSLAKDLHGIFDAVNIFIYIMVGFSLGMSFIILLIMMQNALLEQKRQLSVMRAVGLSIGDISNIWGMQSGVQLLLATLFALPTGIGTAILLFKMCSSPSQIYPFIPDWRVMLLAFGFVTAIVVICHIISMFSIRRFNLADNLRCRE